MSYHMIPQAESLEDTARAAEAVSEDAALLKPKTEVPIMLQCIPQEPGFGPRSLEHFT